MTKRTFSILSFSFVLLILMSKLFFSGQGLLENAASYVSYPALLLSHKIAQPIKKIFFSKQPESYDLLKEECDHLRSKVIQLEAALAYHAKSAELIEFKQRYELDGAILAKVLARTLTKDEHSIIVNRGARDGISKDMIAIYKFQLIGRISKVFPEYSKITLITDKQSKVSAYTNTSNAKGIAEGRNIINRCHLCYVSHLEAMNNGDFVLSSGQGLVFPEGFCLGKIVNLSTKELCYEVELEPLVNLETFEMCHITNQSKMIL